MPIAGFPEVELEFAGLNTLQSPQALPSKYSSICKNAIFNQAPIGSREGTSTYFDLGAGTDIYRAELYTAPSPFVKYYLVLMSDHKLYYSTGPGAGAARTLLFDASGFSTPPVHFRAVPYGNYVFLFFSDGFFGVSAMYVWDPTKLPTVQVDLCTIPPPAIGTMAAADGAAGSVTVGIHLLKVVFVTRTGYVSVPTSGIVTYVAPGAKKISLTNIPVFAAITGHLAAECIERRIIMTEAGLATYYEALVISDNTTTTGTIDIADDQLNQETNYTDNFQFTSPLPGGSTGLIYKEKMCFCGNGSDGSVVYVSETGLPQTFRVDTGFIPVRRNDGQRTVTLFNIRDVLYIVKQRAFFGTSDNGLGPADWPSPMLITEDVGTESIDGVSHLSDQDFAIILDPKQPYVFRGPPPDRIGTNIVPTWLLNNYNAEATAQIAIDTVLRRIYFLVPTGVATRPDTILMCDYLGGWDNLKWSVWTTGGAAWRSIVQDGSLTLLFAASALVRQLDPAAITDNGSAIDYQNHSGVIDPGGVGLKLFGGIDAHPTGAGTLYLKVYGPDNALLQTLTGFTLAATPGKDLFRGFNWRKERIFIEFGHNDVAASSKLYKMSLPVKSDGLRAY